MSMHAHYTSGDSDQITADKDLFAAVRFSKKEADKSIGALMTVDNLPASTIINHQLEFFRLCLSKNFNLKERFKLLDKSNCFYYVIECHYHQTYRFCDIPKSLHQFYLFKNFPTFAEIAGAYVAPRISFESIVTLNWFHFIDPLTNKEKKW